MKPRDHVVVSLLVGAGVYGVSGSKSMAVCSVVAGVLVDLDHLIDFWREYPGVLNPRSFYECCVQFRLKKTYLFLHSLELVVLTAIIAYLLRSRVVAGVAIGLAQHFLFDIIFNPMRPEGILLIYRLMKGAKIEDVFIMDSEKIKDPK